jgi:hypothetical protein
MRLNLTAIPAGSRIEFQGFSIYYQDLNPFERLAAHEK